METVMALLKGAGMGAIAVLVGFLKSAGTDGKLDPFQLKSLAWKAALGAALGAAAVHMGVTFESAYEWAVGVGLITLVDQLIKVVYRRGAEIAKAAVNSGVMIIMLLFIVAALAGCTPNAQFVRAVDEHCSVILPEYQAYVAVDPGLDAASRRIRIESAASLERLIEAALADCGRSPSPDPQSPTPDGR